MQGDNIRKNAGKHPVNLITEKNYAEYLEKMSEKEAFAKILSGTREHTRVLLPWNEKFPEYHEGLHQEIRHNITEVYKELIKLRHLDQAFVYGKFTVLNKKKDRFVYKRSLDGREYIVDCNLGKEERKGGCCYGR